MIGLGAVYILAGLMFAAFAVTSALDRENGKRWRNTAFWGLVATSFLAGNLLTDFASGLLAIALALLAGVGGLGLGRPATASPEQRQASAVRYGNWLFAPALLIPAATLVGTFALKGVLFQGVPLIDPKQLTVVSLAGGVISALVAAMALLRPPLSAPVQEGRRLIDTVGWAAILPQALASLGAVFALAGTGKEIGFIAGRYIPLDQPLVAVCAYTVGMALFTVLTGNGFAAFPVMTAAIGLPFIVHKFGGDPAIMGAIGMLSGFCGTLMTPMAANFNIVPVRLLELGDQWAVIRAQIPTALILLVVNTALMYFLVFRF